MAKLTQSKYLEVPFELCFKYPLERGYTLDLLDKKNLKEFQAFLNRVSQMSVDQVDKLYGRKPDAQDSYLGMQVYHYEVTRAFRIHVINEGGQYKIIRVDPNHRFHS